MEREAVCTHSKEKTRYRKSAEGSRGINRDELRDRGETVELARPERGIDRSYREREEVAESETYPRTLDMST